MERGSQWKEVPNGKRLPVERGSQFAISCPAAGLGSSWWLGWRDPELLSGHTWHHPLLPARGWIWSPLSFHQGQQNFTFLTTSAKPRSISHSYCVPVLPDPCTDWVRYQSFSVFWPFLLLLLQSRAAAGSLTLKDLPCSEGTSAFLSSSCLTTPGCSVFFYSLLCRILRILLGSQSREAKHLLFNFCFSCVFFVVVQSFLC